MREVTKPRQSKEAELIICRYLSQQGKEWCWELLVEEAIPVLTGEHHEPIYEIAYFAVTTLRQRFPNRSWKRAEPADFIEIIRQAIQGCRSDGVVFDVEALNQRRDQHVLRPQLADNSRNELNRMLQWLLRRPAPLSAAQHRQQRGIYGLYRDSRNGFPSKIGETGSTFAKRIPEHVWWGNKPFLVSLVPDSEFPVLRDRPTRVAWQDTLIDLFPGVVHG